MADNLIRLFNEYHQFAILISICISIVVAVLGVVPSVFVTAANVIFFGFWYGAFISFLGEAIGAAIAFLLYRKGFKKAAGQRLNNYARVKKLLNSNGKEAFYLIFSLRLIPFVPSGLITFAAAIGKVGVGIFILASSLGKIPALLMEAYSVDQISQFTPIGKILLFVLAVAILYWVVKRIKTSA